MIAGSVSTLSPKIDAVFCALDSGLANHLKSIKSFGTFHFATLFIPFELKGISACPCNLFCSFQVVLSGKVEEKRERLKQLLGSDREETEEDDNEDDSSTDDDE